MAPRFSRISEYIKKKIEVEKVLMEKEEGNNAVDRCAKGRF